MPTSPPCIVHLDSQGSRQIEKLRLGEGQVCCLKSCGWLSGELIPQQGLVEKREVGTRFEDGDVGIPGMVENMVLGVTQA